MKYNAKRKLAMTKMPKKKKTGKETHRTYTQTQNLKLHGENLLWGWREFSLKHCYKMKIQEKL